MAALEDTRHEQFCAHFARHGNGKQAYIEAGFSSKGAAQSASRMLTRANIRDRIAELKAEVSAATIQLAIADRNARVAALQERWDGMRQVIRERSAAAIMQSVPGGTTGLLCHTQKVIGAGEASKLVDVYEVDTGLLRELRGHEEQAARELGQWEERIEHTGAVSTVDAQVVSLAQIFSPDELAGALGRIGDAEISRQIGMLPMPDGREK